MEMKAAAKMPYVSIRKKTPGQSGELIVILQVNILFMDIASGRKHFECFLIHAVSYIDLFFGKAVAFWFYQLERKAYAAIFSYDTCLSRFIADNIKDTVYLFSFHF